MTPLKIAIAGCGPAGLAAALLLYRDGHDVTLFERFDAPRPIGSGLMLQPTGLAVLAQLGLADTVIRYGARVDRLIGKTGDAGRSVLDVRYTALGSSAGFGVGIHRASLFGALYIVLPFVRDRLVGPLSKLWPATWIQAAMVSGLIGNPFGPLGLAVASSLLAGC